MELQLSGLASGFDWLALVDQLTELQRAPQSRLLQQQSTLLDQKVAYGSLVTELNLLKNRVDALNSSSLYDARTASLSTFGVATASASAGTPMGSYTFAFSQLATAARQVGGSDIGGSLNATNDVSTLVLSDAAFAAPVTAGSFTVNGQTITVATSDTLQDVFDQINNATGGSVTASYNAGTDKITLSSASAITLGSAADTSNFLSAAKLSNNGTGSIVSSATLGVLKRGSPMVTGNFDTAISDGGSGAGAFKINGVTINFNASTDTLTDVIDRINNSSAGVTAQYDTVTDRVTLTNKTTGDVGIALQDVTGNFLAATKLTTAAGGTLEAGQDLQYTVNGGPTLTSHSNTVTSDSHGITGLTVNALSAGTSATTSNSGNIGFPQLVEFFGTSSGAATRMRTVPDHGYQTGYAVKFASTGTLPSMVDSDTVYYVRRVDADDVSIHTSAADAVSGANPINFGTNPPYTGSAYIYQVDPLEQTVDGEPSTVTVTVESNADDARTAIADFVEQYNKVQSLIGTLSASSTDEDGKVTAGVLAGDRDIASVASTLRSRVFSSVSGLSGAIDFLAELGYQTNGDDDTIALTDSAALDEALASNLSDVQDFFTNATNGLAVTLSDYLEQVAGDEGTLVEHQELLTDQSTGIDDQIASLERLVQANRDQLINQFVAMERMQAQLNQQLQFLLRQIGQGS